MSTVRKQTIQSSILVYIGFAIGAINMLFYTRNGSFTPQQFGLTTLFFSFSQMGLVIASFGINPVIYKFYPYYNDNLHKKENDLLTWGLSFCLVGFLLVCLLALSFREFIVAEYAIKSPLLVQYFYLLLPFSFGMIVFSLLESYGWAIGKAVFTNFLKETVFRAVTLLFILGFFFGWLNFSQFMYCFTFLYIIIAIWLFIFLYKKGELNFTFSISRVTKKFWKKMMQMQALFYFGVLVAAIGNTIDAFLINHIIGDVAVGVFAFAQYGGNILQVPQRSIQSVSLSIVSKAWKNKNYPEINRLYQRSCINLLLISLFLFGLMWLNVKPALAFLHIQKDFENALSALFILGITRTIDAGTGINGVIIGTSTYWRFDFLSSVFLLALRLPLTYYCITKFGIIGSAIADLAAVSGYNFIRFEFLRRKFNMQPFSYKTVLAILLALLAYYIAFYAGSYVSNSLIKMAIQTTLFSAIVIGGVFALNLTPDARQMYYRWVKKEV